MLPTIFPRKSGKIIKPRYFEIGTVNAATVVVIFNMGVHATDYATGVTIKKNTVPQAIDSADHHNGMNDVYYVLEASVAAGTTVTWEYAAATGDYKNLALNKTLANVAATAVVNNVA